MSSTRFALVPLFLGAAIFGGYATIGSITKNGFGEVIGALKEGRVAILRGAPEPYKTAYTGVAAIDNQLSVLVAFFSPLVDGPVPADVRLFYVWGMAQFVASWTLLMLEGLRVGNRGRLVSLVSVVGLVFQNLTWTFTVPIYLAIHLLTSPVAKLKNGDGDAGRQTLFVYLWDLALLPMSVTISFVVPAIFMSLPHLLNQNAATHWNWIAFWQPFPLWNIIALKFLHYVCYYALGSLTPRDEEARPTTPGNAYMVAVRGVYEFGLTLCAVTHLPVIIISIAPTGLRTIFLSVFPYFKEIFEQASFSGTFVPSWITNSPTVIPTGYAAGDLAPLAQHFLQYDLYVGTAPLLIWSAYLYMTTAKDASFATAIQKTVFWMVVGGPAAACLALIWERDDVVKEGEGKAVLEGKKTR
ncbi:hypothetical protein F5Y15DRAFT_378979 [Xylariaceae sp. FL0016]|nr:hypothetical protein F5Y15DRAFT_378979 [Xylariaceae sp. FL0016]